MGHTLRDTSFGTFVRLATGKRLLKFPEEEEGFKLPETWVQVLEQSSTHSRSVVEKPQTRNETPSSASSTPSSSIDAEDARGEQAEEAEPNPYEAGQNLELARSRSRNRELTTNWTPERLEVDEEHEIEKTKSIPIVPEKTQDGAILVDWYYTDDPENPQNWSNTRRAFILVVICLYTFVVYSSSAIYTSSEKGVMTQFGVGQTEASLGLALFVLGYGTGPLLFSPLSEVPRIGRNPVYIITIFLFVIISIPTAVVDNYPGLMVLRFLQGFFGSPCLASGAASLGDMYSMINVSYALIAWVSAAFCGPALGPLLSGFSVPVLGWRWSLLEILWASIPIFFLMFLFLPETSAENILLRRAARLRRLTGSPRFMSASEIRQRNLKPSAVLLDALIKPLEITIKDPAMLFVQVYTAIIYCIYYSFFEVFPLVYPVFYHFNLGQVGLVFLCVLVACFIGIGIYVAYLALYMIPRIKARGFPVNETRLVPALAAAFGPTIGLFIFAWTAAPQFPWIAPTIGITVYAGSAFVLMQCIFIYVPISYPQYAASLFAANDFFRSALACGSIIFAKPLFGNLGVARGVSLLGGLSVIGIIGIWLLYFYGAKLRSMSKFAVSDN